MQRAIQGVADGVAAAGLGALDAVGGIIRGRRSRSLGARVSINPTVAVYPAEHGSDDPAIPPRPQREPPRPLSPPPPITAVAAQSDLLACHGFPSAAAAAARSSGREPSPAAAAASSSSRAPSPAAPSEHGSTYTSAAGDSDESDGPQHDGQVKTRRQVEVEVRANRWDTQYACLSRPDVGNIGFALNNFGQRPQTEDGYRRVLDAQLKKSPAQVIALAECEESVAELLQRPPVEEDPDAQDAAVAASQTQVQKFLSRNEHAYVTLRGAEKASVCLAVRVETAEDIDLLHWERKYEGLYTSSTKTKNKLTPKPKKKAYTRILIGRIKLHNNVGFIGRSLVVAVVHLHFTVGKNMKHFKEGHQEFWNKIAEFCRTFGIDILLGDFNMSLWRVVPELRRRGVPASLVAWYPWTADVDGALKPFTDSMGIFTVREDCTARPALGPEVLFNKEALNELDVHHKDNGPGKPLEVYLPKECPLLEKLNETFRYSNPYVPKDHPTAVAVGGEGKRGQGGGEGKGVEGKRFYMKQKPFSTAVATQYKGQVKNGSHFPLAAFTENQTRRSPEAIYRRRQSTREKKQRQGEQRWQEWSAGEAAHWAAVEGARAAEKAEEQREDEQWLQKSAAGEAAHWAAEEAGHAADKSRSPCTTHTGEVGSKIEQRMAPTARHHTPAKGMAEEAEEAAVAASQRGNDWSHYGRSGGRSGGRSSGRSGDAAWGGTKWWVDRSGGHNNDRSHWAVGRVADTQWDAWRPTAHAYADALEHERP